MKSTHVRGSVKKVISIATVVLMATISVVFGLWTAPLASSAPSGYERSSLDAPLRAYMGLNIPPSAWARFSNDVVQTAGVCARQRGVIAPTPQAQPKVSAPDEMRISKPSVFAAQYGYGVQREIAEEQLTEPQADTAMAATVAVGAPALTRDDGASAEVVSSCTDTALRSRTPFVPPAESQARYGELYAAAVQTIVQSSEAITWSRCMAARGFESQSPMGAGDVVFKTAIGLERNHRQLPEDDGLSGWHLSASELGSLKALEMNVYVADNQCLNSSGLGALSARTFASVITRLRSEFPQFKGINFQSPT